MFRFVCLLFVAVSVFGAPSKIACIGDSITQGYNTNNPALESVTRPSFRGALTAQAINSLFRVGSRWTVLDGVPFRDGDLLRQTNTVASAAQRYFRLARP